MKFKIFIIIFLCLLTIISTKTHKTDHKCFYNSTVDLTNQTHYSNGSYVYQGILIPPENQSLYNYNLHFRDKKVSARLHLRGCVCNDKIFCIKFCCKINEFFNTTSHKCEKLLKDFPVNWNLTMGQITGENKTVNVLKQYIYQVGVPCQEPVALVKNEDKWDLKENGNIYLRKFNIKLDTISYCFTPYKFNKSREYSLIPLSCPMKPTISWTLIINTYAMAVSVLFLISTIVVYLLIKELRTNLRAKLLICYLLSMTVAYSIISFINISHIKFNYIPCTLLGYGCYFFFEAAYFWLSVLCYDIWHNFKEVNIELNSRSNNQRFIFYSLHAWGWSTLFTWLTVTADLAPGLDKDYKPGIGIEMCWLNTQQWSAAIYFYGPNLVILLCNFITFTIITVHIYNVRRESAKITHTEHENIFVIIRLFLIMGVSWIFDILSYCFPNKGYWQVVFVLSDLINAAQGFLIFTMFVMKPSVLKLLKKRFTSKLKRSPSTLTTTFKLETAI